ncbi:MAG: tetratricopeptide repeat protein [Candidatus Euphemobacter frigidus]|nr:tetratricopeptide repeat protein [Candidatus Euphemobacter frigidus]MDP8276174.1 tetratricopeptide repeat protein [Candidatus Euphemobacter frigidus]
MSIIKTWIVSCIRPAKKLRWLPLVLIILAGVAVYLSSLSGSFIWDDVHFIKNNVYLRSPVYLPRIMTEDVAAGSGEDYNYYRPLTTVTYLIDYSFWRLNPAGYHISSILSHILVAGAVYLLIGVLFKENLLAFLTALLYVIHPIQTETVAYISGRPDSLAAFCLLVCFISYLKCLDGGSLPLTGLVFFSYLLALLSRENSVVLPGLLLLFHVTFKRRVKLSLFLILAGMAAGYVLLRKLFLGPVIVPTTLAERVPGFFAAVTSYVKLILFPIHLHQEYGFALFRFTDLEVPAGILIAVLLLSVALRAGLKKTAPFRSPGAGGSLPRRLIFFSVFWFFIAIIPVSGIYPIKAYIAEHWLYLPSIGVFTLLAAGYVSLLRLERYRGLVIALGIVVLFCYGILTIKQNNYFYEPLTFYERTLRYNPGSARMHNNLGNNYFNRGRKEDAVRSYRRAISLDPGYPNPYNNLGNVYYQAGDFDRAVPLFQRAIELNPAYAAAYNNLGIIYCRLDRPVKGILMLKRAAAINPLDSDTLYNLGVAYDLAGRPREAVEMYRKSLRLMPDVARVHSRLAEALRRLGQTEQADYHLYRSQELGY